MLRHILCLTAILALGQTAALAGSDTAAQAIAQKFAEDAPSKPQRPSLDYEMEMLKQARAEQADRKQASKAIPLTNVGTATPAVAATPAPVTLPLPAAKSAVAQTAPVGVPSPVPPAATTVTPAPAAPPAAAPPAPAHSDVQAKAEPAPATAAVVANGPASRATMLLALETGGVSKGIAPSYDPMLCFADSCFISAGMKSDAVKLARIDAIKLKSTSDASPDSCKGKVACVFRGVTVPDGAQVHVVELGSASHGPETARDVQLDKTCKMIEGDLVCENPISSPDFRIWVVPEDVARSAGPQAFEDALADGLPEEDVARATDK